MTTRILLAEQICQKKTKEFVSNVFSKYNQTMNNTFKRLGLIKRYRFDKSVIIAHNKII